MPDIEVNFKSKKKALAFKKHLEKTHPSTRGKVKLERDYKKRKIMPLTCKSNKMIKRSLRNSPDFQKIAGEYTKL